TSTTSRDLRHSHRRKRVRKPGIKINLTDVDVLPPVGSVYSAENRTEFIDVETSSAAALESRQESCDLFGGATPLMGTELYALLHIRARKGAVVHVIPRRCEHVGNPGMGSSPRIARPERLTI